MKGDLLKSKNKANTLVRAGLLALLLVRLPRGGLAGLAAVGGVAAEGADEGEKHGLGAVVAAGDGRGVHRRGRAHARRRPEELARARLSAK